MDFIDALQWRYATKKMNGKKVPQEKVDKIIEAARLAPSVAGLQPYQVIVVTNRELLQKIQPVANNQSQITDASHLLIFAAWDHIDADRINAVFDHIIAERQQPEEKVAAYRSRMLEMFPSRDPEVNFQYAARQAYIGFGMAIMAAALQEVDATPMEGFNAAALDELLQLKQHGLRSVSLLPLGYRDAENDWLVNLKKVRRAPEQFLIILQ
jgi:nitroreductase